MAIGKAAIGLILSCAAWAQQSAAQQFEVRHEHWRKFCVGTLTIDEAGIRFNGPKGHAWNWPYAEIQQLTLYPGSIRILSYKDSSNWKLGKDVAYTFTGEFPAVRLARQWSAEARSALRGRRCAARRGRRELPGEADRADQGDAGQADFRRGCRGVRYASRGAHMALQGHTVHFQRRPLSALDHDFGKAVRFSIEAEY